MYKRYVGERIMQNCGEVAEILELLPNAKCKIRFDSGIEKECFNNLFKAGKISNKVAPHKHIKEKVYERHESKKYIGEIVKQNCGVVAEIIEELPYHRCTVKLDDDTCIKCFISDFYGKRLIPPFMKVSGCYYVDRVTGERVLDLYYDEKTKGYVGY